MTAQDELYKQLSTLNNLPTLPHILLNLMAACNQESQNMDKIADLVSNDPALSASILKLVNSAYFGLPRKVEAVGQAVMLVGTSGIKNLAICACVYEAFPKPKADGIFSLKNFWWHALRCAFLAKHMAFEMGICQPDEAFLAGLLHDIGKAVLWVNCKKTYEALLATSGNDKDRLLAGEAQMGATHAEVGAWLLDRWRLDPSIADCVRHHHEQPERIAQAFAMVQIVHVANLLCQDTESEINAGLATAHTLFGQTPAECQALRAKSDQEAGEIASSLGIDVDRNEASAAASDEDDRKVHDRLNHEVKHLSLLVGTLDAFLEAEDQSGVLKCITEGLNILFDIKYSLFFLMDEKRNALIGYLPDKLGQYVRQPALSISMNMTGSLLVRTLVDRDPLDSYSAAAMDPLAIIDEQLIRLLGGNELLCLPLVAQKDSVGVLALGLDAEDLPHLLEHIELLNIFLHKGASAIRLEKFRSQQLQMIQATRIDASIDLARRVVHEVNNPLSIIKNYLKVLGMKMADAGIEHDEIRIISQEITRVGQLVNKLTTFSTTQAPNEAMTDVNALLADMLRLTRDSLLSEANIHVYEDLEPNLPTIVADPDGLKQVLINLIKNAAEAMAGAGGNLKIRTRHISPALGEKLRGDVRGPHGYVEIVVRDDGPGVPQAIKERLFDPYVSAKRGDHPGLGLSVVYNTIKSLQGTIVCESAPNQGTVFTIELPVKTRSSVQVAKGRF